MKIKRIVTFCVTVCMLFGLLSACGKKDDSSSSDGNKVLSVYIWSEDGKTPEGFDEVLSYFNKNYSSELGFTVKFKFDTQSDYKQNLNLSMAAGENNYDLVFDAAWIYLNDFAKKEYYYKLDDYFKAGSGYDGLVNAFSQEYLNGNLYNNGVYGVPLTETYGDISVAYIRKDWRKACAADETFVIPEGKLSSTVVASDLNDGIDSFDELQYYLYWVKENKNGITPCLSNNDATWGAWDVINSRALPTHSAKDYVNAGIKQEIKLTSTITATAYISRGEVKAAYLNDIEDPNSSKGLSSFPANFNTVDNSWQDNFNFARTWATDGIISSDVLQVTDSDAKFNAGMGGCVVQSISKFSSVEQKLKTSDANAELEIFVNQYAIRNKLSGYAQTDYKAWNNLCVPVSVSKERCDMAMKFLNWIFQSEEHHDLFQYGIKGTHWNVAKDGEGQEIDGTVTTVGMKAYSFPAYELTWNSNFIRVSYASDPKVMEYEKYMYDSNRYVGILYSEFTFDHTASQALTTALANADIASSATEATSWYLGQIDSPVASWQSKLNTRYSNSSMQSAALTIKNELIRQLQAFIDEQ